MASSSLSPAQSPVQNEDNSTRYVSAKSPSSSPWIRKPLHIIRQQESGQMMGGGASPGGHSTASAATRHMSLLDLISVGVGGTIGSGIFVLTGQIAHHYAGPYTCVSFIVAGIAASCSGICFAELSARLPIGGSTYVYAYACWGEVIAIIAAACLTLEYGVAGAAVARSWGDKILLWWLSSSEGGNDTIYTDEDFEAEEDRTVNIPAGVLSLASTFLLLAGVHESKQVTNLFTLLKLVLVLFMTVGGFCLWNSENMTFEPIAAATAAAASQSSPSSSKGLTAVGGVFRGATSSFFGYLGYDEVCCIAGEAMNPRKDMPRAVLGTLTIVTLVYVFASLALTGMLPPNEISPTSAFPQAFASNDWLWASQLTAIGELVTLPVVVLISLMAQPRLFLGMSNDGLISSRIFGTFDENGNLRESLLVCGLVMTVLATFVPFKYLDDLISAGILVAFSITNSSLVLLKCESPPQVTATTTSTTTAPSSHLLEKCLISWNIGCFVTSILWTHNNLMGTSNAVQLMQQIVAMISTLGTIAVFITMTRHCPKSKRFGGSVLLTQQPQPNQEKSTANGSKDSEQLGNGEEETFDYDDEGYFSTPCVPYLPCAGMAINWYLIAQLEASGIMMLVLYLGAAVAAYFACCARHSVGHNTNWTPVATTRARRTLLGGRNRYNAIGRHGHNSDDEDNLMSDDSEGHDVALRPLTANQANSGSGEEDNDSDAVYGIERRKALPRSNSMT